MENLQLGAGAREVRKGWWSREARAGVGARRIQQRMLCVASDYGYRKTTGMRSARVVVSAFWACRQLQELSGTENVVKGHVCS